MKPTEEERQSLLASIKAKREAKIEKRRQTLMAEAEKRKAREARWSSKRKKRQPESEEKREIRRQSLLATLKAKNEARAAMHGRISKLLSELQAKTKVR